MLRIAAVRPRRGLRSSQSRNRVQQRFVVDRVGHGGFRQREQDVQGSWSRDRGAGPGGRWRWRRASRSESTSKSWASSRRSGSRTCVVGRSGSRRTARGRGRAGTGGPAPGSGGGSRASPARRDRPRVSYGSFIGFSPFSPWGGAWGRAWGDRPRRTDQRGRHRRYPAPSSWRSRRASRVMRSCPGRRGSVRHRGLEGEGQAHRTFGQLVQGRKDFLDPGDDRGGLGVGRLQG